MGFFMRPARRSSGAAEPLGSSVKTKNVLLTLWLAAPILVVALLCYWIFASFSSDQPHLKPRAVGVGANDTGGANALGEWLAGRDPDEVQRLKRDLREGRLIDPYQWPGGIELRVQAAEGSGPMSVLLYPPAGRLDELVGMVMTSVDPTHWHIVLLPEDFSQGQVVVVAPAGGKIEDTEHGVVVRHPDGEELAPIDIGLVPSDPEREQTEPIVIEISIE